MDEKNYTYKIEKCKKMRKEIKGTRKRERERDQNSYTIFNLKDLSSFDNASSIIH